MKKLMSLGAAAALCLVCVPAFAQAEVYLCVDQSGKKDYVTSPKKGAGCKKIELPSILVPPPPAFHASPTDKGAIKPRQHVVRRPRYPTSACESDHWVESVSRDGQIVRLEDGSIWEVDPADAIDSALWLPTTEIVACDDKLINTDDGESVWAIRIR